jgi:hypothetical protein
MRKVQELLQDKKTYIVALALVVYAIAGVYTNQMTSQEAILVVLNGLGLGALRAGIK